MSRFLFYTDLHLSARSPIHRIDDFPQTLLKKMKETYALAHSEDCDFVVFGGDFFNTHRIYSYDIINAAMDIMCESDLMTYGIIGQHDLHGYNPKTYDTSALAFAVKRCSMFKTVWEPEEFDDMVLYASHVWDDVRKDLIQTVAPDKASVLIAHHLISKDIEMFDVVKTSGLDSNFDLVISGDLHTGFETHKIKDTTFANPGSMARQSTRGIDRMPKVLVIDIDQDELQIKEIFLESGKPGKEVFGKDIIEAVRVTAEMNTTAFIDNILELEAESVDVFDLVERAGQQKGTSKKVLSYIMSKKSA